MSKHSNRRREHAVSETETVTQADIGDAGKVLGLNDTSQDAGDTGEAQVEGAGDAADDAAKSTTEGATEGATEGTTDAPVDGAAQAETAPVVPVKKMSKEAVIREIMTANVDKDMWTVCDLIVADPRIAAAGGVPVDVSRARAYYTWISKLHDETGGVEGAPGKAIPGRRPKAPAVHLEPAEAEANVKAAEGAEAQGEAAQG